MATDSNTTWGERGKKTSVIALALVAILAGVAIAYFLRDRTFAGNRAVGGQLTVDATLPLDFSEDTLYPTNSDGAADFASQDFTITNNNTVKVKYEIYSTCLECIPDPADTEDQAKARADKIDQFNNLYVDIQTSPAPECEPLDTATNSIPEEVQDVPTDPLNLNKACGAPVYHGRLADMKGDAPVQLGELAAEGDQTYTVKLWLKNDPNRAQPQAVVNLWEFVINAKTPAS